MTELLRDADPDELGKHDDKRKSCASGFSAPCYPAWEIFAGKSTKIFALPSHNTTAQGRIKAGALAQSQSKRLDAAAIKISVGFYKNCAAIFYTYKNNIIT
ncbi:hypothetical protein [Pedobacter zeae]|uniref:Uncharacterized protein n=1 Tax=Pedobacter zeae TaxID=1737356 RepID=A0A7W6KB04_9SPHI|nr:hypothetical protein [Pedobacter zeae]MBB4108478.1 hypothetical protein [Pedobacter zeae]GGG92543.1 hypothetical protein GCM10007422_02020 [Pedobacter zeae]